MVDIRILPFYMYEYFSCIQTEIFHFPYYYSRFGKYLILYSVVFWLNLGLIGFLPIGPSSSDFAYGIKLHKITDNIITRPPTPLSPKFGQPSPQNNFHLFWFDLSWGSLLGYLGGHLLHCREQFGINFLKQMDG